ncbi:hypothetical protein SRHO_G00038030 [Serrasalmus rhombeus]
MSPYGLNQQCPGTAPGHVRPLFRQLSRWPRTHTRRGLEQQPSHTPVKRADVQTRSGLVFPVSQRRGTDPEPSPPAGLSFF